MSTFLRLRSALLTQEISIRREATSILNSLFEFISRSIKTQFWTILDNCGKLWAIVDNSGHLWTILDN